MATPVAHTLAMPDADVTLYPGFFGRLESDTLFQALQDEIAWKQETIKFWGKAYPLPRLTTLYGNAGKSYAYSGITDQPRHEPSHRLGKCWCDSAVPPQAPTRPPVGDER